MVNYFLRKKINYAKILIKGRLTIPRFSGSHGREREADFYPKNRE